MPPLSFEDRLAALEAIVEMVKVADQIAALGFLQSAREKYEEIADMLALYQERVA